MKKNSSGLTRKSFIEKNFLKSLDHFVLLFPVEFLSFYPAFADVQWFIVKVFREKLMI